MSDPLTNPNVPVTKKDLSDFYKKIYPYLGGSGIPEGGSTGQILSKKSNVNGDVEWTDNEGGSTVISELQSLSTLMSEFEHTVSSESTAQSEIDFTQNSSLNSLSTASSELSSEVAVLNSEIAEKQDVLTAGPNITISGNIISSRLGMEFSVVDALPITDISTTTIYLLPKSDTDTDDIYDEWAYINNAWEHLGHTKIDLSNYYDKTQIDSKFTSQSTIDSTQTSQISSLSQSASEIASIVTSQSTAQSEVDSLQNRSINSLSAENSSQTSKITSLSSSSSELARAVTTLNSEVATKQDKLTAGTGVSIQNNVISVTGEGQGGGDVSSEVESLIASMSALTSTVSSESTAQYEIDSLQNSYLNSLTSENVVRRFEISSLFTDTSELGSEVDIINSEVAVINSDIAAINSELDTKQDILTPGPGISISGTTISANTTTSFKIVSELPTTNIITTIIYLLPKSDSDTNDYYDEWAYINDAWEKIGNTKIDLSNYYDKTQVDNKFTSQSAIDSTQTSRISSLSQSASEFASNVTSQSTVQSEIDSLQNRSINSLSTENGSQSSEIESLSTASSELGSEIEDVNSELAEKQNSLTPGLGIDIDENNIIRTTSAVIYAQALFPSGS